MTKEEFKTVVTGVVLLTTEEFRTVVQEMRNAQIEYFRTRSAAALVKAKRLERAVDDALAEFRDLQRLLFDKE